MEYLIKSSPSSGGLIVAIGAQNAFVLKLLCNHSLCDFLLMALG